MIEFDSFKGLKKFIEMIYDFLQDNPFGSSGGAETFGDVEKFFLESYSLYGGENAAAYRYIAGSFLQISQILIPLDNLGRIYKYLIYFESMEHLIRREKSGKEPAYYRDHILHPANVCWIGENLIFNPEVCFYNHIKRSLDNILPVERKSLLKTEESWENFIRTIWYVTSLAHDIGYLVELFEEKFSGSDLYLTAKNYLIFNKLNNYLDTRLSHKNQLFREQLKKIDKQLVNYPFLYSSSVHPIISSFELLHSLDNNRSKITEKKILYEDIYQLAALGIFEHHSKKKIHFEWNPFGYILALSDIIHEWDRPINVGFTKEGRPEFISPVKRGAIIKEKQNLYNIQYEFCDPIPMEIIRKGMDEKIFLTGKQKELDRLEFDSNLPQFKFQDKKYF